MPRRRPTGLRHPPEPLPPSLWALWVTRDGATSHRLVPGQPLALGGAGGGRPLLALNPSPGEGRVEVQPAEGQRVYLNDVQLAGSSLARPGDWVRVGEDVLLLEAVSQARRAGSGPWTFEGFEQRLHEEVARAARFHRPFTVWALKAHLPSGPLHEELSDAALDLGVAFSAGELARGVLGVVLPELSLAQAEPLRARVTAALARAGAPLEEGWASFPKDGPDAHALLGRALDRLLGEDAMRPEEPLRVDPVMERLYALADRFARMPGPVLLVGEPSVGKESFARALHATGGRGAFVVATEEDGPEERWRSAEERSQGGTLYVKHLPGLPAAALERLKRLPQRVVASAPEHHAFEASVSLVIPPLRDRKSEILPLAESFLARAAQALGGPRLVLGATVQELLVQDRWPGNLRELKNAMVRAALMADGDEVKAEHLPPRLLRERPRALEGGGLRATLKEAERATLLGMLARTSWNVTAAARELGLPRRTVVYRMARLGLRRPR